MLKLTGPIQKSYSAIQSCNGEDIVLVSKKSFRAARFSKSSATECRGRDEDPVGFTRRGYVL